MSNEDSLDEFKLQAIIQLDENDSPLDLFGAVCALLDDRKRTNEAHRAELAEAHASNERRAEEAHKRETKYRAALYQALLFIDEDEFTDKEDIRIYRDLRKLAPIT